MAKTLKFEIITGINEGYFHNNECEENLKVVSKVWQEIAEEEYSKSNIYISAVLREGKTVYNEKWGCPSGGEDTVIITGTANLEFIDDLSLWRECVINITRKLKKILVQSTITCEFTETDLYYFRDDIK